MKLFHLHALRSRNLKLYFLGQSLSLTGTWITSIASSWLVYRLTGSEFYLGLVVFCGQFPSAVCSPFAGVFIDHWDKRRVLLATQALSLVQSATLAYLTLTNQVTIDHILALSLFQAFVNAFDMPARQSLISELVTNREDLPNAIALSSAMFHGSRLIGPAIAGFLIAAYGEGVCFAIDTISYTAVIASLLLIFQHNSYRQTRTNSWRHALVDGVRYVSQHPSIGSVITLVAILALFGTAFITLLPVFAIEEFAGGPKLYGYLAAASGLGAFIGALNLAARPHSDKSEQFLARMRLLFSICVMAFALSPNVIIAYLALVGIGYTMVSVFAGSNTLLQMVVEDGKRARVMSIYSAAFFGLMPIGGLLAGSAATYIGAPATVFIGGLVCLIVALHGLKKP